MRTRTFVIKVTEPDETDDKASIEGCNVVASELVYGNEGDSALLKKDIELYHSLMPKKRPMPILRAIMNILDMVLRGEAAKRK